ncbi:hypothetical protein SCALM49S_03858 [Streptomyces californicus]
MPRGGGAGALVLVLGRGGLWCGGSGGAQLSGGGDTDGELARAYVGAVCRAGTAVPLPVGVNAPRSVVISPVASPCSTNFSAFWRLMEWPRPVVFFA